MNSFVYYYIYLLKILLLIASKATYIPSMLIEFNYKKKYMNLQRDDSLPVNFRIISHQPGTLVGEFILTLKLASILEMASTRPPNRNSTSERN